MIKGLTRAGLGERSDRSNRSCDWPRRYGFGAVDAGGGELREWAEQDGIDAARESLQALQVVIGNIGLPVEWRAERSAASAKASCSCAKDAEIAAQFGVKACCTYILPATDAPAAHFMALATRRMRQCAEILGAFGIRLGLEFVGPHHLRTQWKHPFIWTMDETLDWIDAIGKPNVGLLLDAYHWYTTEAGEADLLRLRPDQIVYVHINDAKPVPVAEALDNDRLYPGEGVIDLATFLRALHTIGYKGVVAQEILTPTPPAETSEALLERSAAGFRKVFAAAGLA